jgi:hypothetical protein
VLPLLFKNLDVVFKVLLWCCCGVVFQELRYLFQGVAINFQELRYRFQCVAVDFQEFRCCFQVVAIPVIFQKLKWSF